MRTKIRILTLIFVFFLLLISSIAYGVNEILFSKISQPSYLLVVTGSGTGTGTIASNIYGINCTSTAGVESGNCSALIPMGTTVILTTTPDANSIFSGWIGGGCGGIGICSVLIDGNKTINAELSLIPHGANLVGWYKVNEGSGSTVYNYAPLSAERLPNLPLINFGNFWTLMSGFGSANAVNKNYCLWVDAASTLSTSALGCRGSFLYVTGADFPYPMIFNHTNSIVAAADSPNYISYDTGTLRVGIRFNNASSIRNLTAPVTDHWWFVFNAYEDATHFRSYAVKDDGTLLTGTTIGTYLNEVIRQIRFFRFYDTTNTRYNHFYGSVGDTLQYRGICLTLSEWRITYNTLRTRYGMLAPSGW